MVLYILSVEQRLNCSVLDSTSLACVIQWKQFNHNCVKLLSPFVFFPHTDGHSTAQFVLHATMSQKNL
jgi:hypothetical protein